MAKMEIFLFMAALISSGVSSVLYWWHVAALRTNRKRVRAASLGAASVESADVKEGFWDAGRFATIISINGLLFLTLSLIARWTATGHGPFSNMYEYSAAWAWGILVASIYFQWKYRTTVLSAVALPIATAFLIYAYTLPSRPTPLVPALQQSLLLTLHVAVAIIAYGVSAIGFGAALFYLVQLGKRIQWLPAPAMLDDIGYRSVIIGFPFMTLTLVLGALWADIAWGRYWSWDPKELATLVTWFIYGAYLHSRTLRGWKGTKSAILLMLGFGAAIFTYMGNYFFSGLHAYK